MSKDTLLIIGVFFLIVGIASLLGLLIIRWKRCLQSKHRTTDSLVAGSSTSVMVGIPLNIEKGDIVVVEGKEIEILGVSVDGYTLTYELCERKKNE